MWKKLDRLVHNHSIFNRVWEIAGAVSIRTKLLGLALGLVLLVGFGNILQARSVLSKNMEAQLRDQSVSEARDLAARAVDPILLNDLLALQDLLLETKSNNTNVRYAFIIDQRGQVIGAHIEEGAAAGLIVVVGIGVPRFVAVTDDECGRRHGFTDPSVVDELAAGLQPGAEEGIGSGAYAKPLLARKREHGPAILAGNGEGLFVVDGFARAQRGECDLGMRRGYGEVEHEIDLGIVQDLVERARFGNLVLLGLGLGALGNAVAARDDLDRLELFGVLEVDLTDISATHESDVEGSHGGILYRLAQSMPRCMMAIACGVSKSLATCPRLE